MFYGELLQVLKIDNADFVFPRLTVLGKLGMSVEGHRGLLYFSENEVRFKVKQGALCVLGEKLKLFETSGDSAIVGGIIKAVSYD